jgi:magnesium transporter
MEYLHSQVIEFDLIKETSREIPWEKFTLDHSEKNKIYWINVDLNEKEILFEITEKLNLPNELIDLLSNEDTSKKVIDLENSLTIQVSDILENRSKDKYSSTFSNLIIHLSNQFCLTASFNPLTALLKFKEEYPINIKFANTPGFILFLILDNIINDYSTILQKNEFISDELDVSIREIHKGSYREVMGMKNQIMKIKRHASSIRDVLMRISGRKINVISEPCRQALINLLDHIKIIVNETDALRELLNNDLDLIDNSLMQNMNKSIGILTAFSAIFLPLAVITGIYGMNFHWIPELEWKYGYFYVLTLMVLCTTGLLIYFKKKKWIFLK